VQGFVRELGDLAVLGREVVEAGQFADGLLRELCGGDQEVAGVAECAQISRIHGIELINIYPTGTCFDDAMELVEEIIKSDKSKLSTLFLVHGICREPGGELFSHAWVEEGDSCYFDGIINGEQAHIECDRAGFHDHFDVQEFTRYTMHKAFTENIRTNNFGPWEEKYLALCGRDREKTTFSLCKSNGGEIGIHCNGCGSVSYNPHDVENRYCGKCDKFLED